MPKHVAIVMDGNGRWAKEKNLPLIAGHKKGADTAFNISEAAHRMGIEWLTLYTFSTENWKRPDDWITDFMGILKWYLDNEIKQLVKNNVKLHVIGDISAFSDSIKEGIEKALQKTKNNTGLNLVLALNYGGRADIVQAVQKIAHRVEEKDILVDEITEDVISRNLYTQDIPDPDLVIRTSGEYRISNFLLWQIAYAEFAFSTCYWPDFTVNDFEEIIKSYQLRERRYGQYFGK